MLKNISNLEGIEIVCLPVYLSMCLSYSKLMFTDRYYHIINLIIIINITFVIIIIIIIINMIIIFSTIIIIISNSIIATTIILSSTQSSSYNLSFFTHTTIPHYTTLSFYIDGAPGTYSSTTGGYGKVKKNKKHT